MRIPEDISRMDWQVLELLKILSGKKEVAHTLRITVRRVQQIAAKHKAKSISHDEQQEG